MTTTDLSQLSMHELFRAEAENQTQVLTASLLALERNPTAADHLEACMRSAHSLKGAARIVDIGAGVTLAHAMEDLFVAAQHGRIVLDQGQIDRLLQGVDLMMAIARRRKRCRVSRSICSSPTWDGFSGILDSRCVTGA